jgi:hypothetical protein
MAAAGWWTDPAADTWMADAVVESFRFPLNDNFAVTTRFAWLSDYPPLEVDTAIGFSYTEAVPALAEASRSRGQTHSELRVGVDELGRPHWL